MVSLAPKIGAIATGTLLSLSVTNVEPLQAAGFSMEFLGGGQGFVEFQNTSLKGYGRETTSVSQIRQENSQPSLSAYLGDYFGYYKDTEVPFVYYSLPDDTTLDFNFGRLTGVNFVIEDDDYFVNSGPWKDFSVEARGKTSFIATGDRYEVLFTGTATITTGYITSEIVSTTTTYNNDPIRSGSIMFNTREPIPLDSAAVPEPLTCMGALTALGFGIAVKRKLARKS